MNKVETTTMYDDPLNAFQSQSIGEENSGILNV